MPELTDLSYVRALCEKYDFALSKGFGQNFIINPGIPQKIVDVSGVDKRYGVIEIGPGIGVLTRELAKRAAKVVSIEVDERLPPLLAETMAGVDNFKLVMQDVLKVDLRALIAEEFPGMPVALCANLPYYITSPIVMKLLGDRLPIESLTVMVQKEAADRLAATPGTRASSAISCAVSYYATVEDDVHRRAGQLLPGPQGDQRGGSHGHPPYPRRAGSGRGGLFCPHPRRLRPAPQDRRQRHRQRPFAAPRRASSPPSRLRASTPVSAPKPSRWRTSRRSKRHWQTNNALRPSAYGGQMYCSPAKSRKYLPNRPSGGILSV